MGEAACQHGQLAATWTINSNWLWGKKGGGRYGSIGNGGEVNHSYKERKGNGDKRERERERERHKEGCGGHHGCGDVVGVVGIKP